MSPAETQEFFTALLHEVRKLRAISTASAVGQSAPQDEIALSLNEEFDKGSGELDKAANDKLKLIADYIAKLDKSISLLFDVWQIQT